MKISEKTLKTLEFDKIRQLLAECALTEGARGLCAKVYESAPSENPCEKRTRKQNFRVRFVLREQRSQIAYSYSLPIFTRRS